MRMPRDAPAPRHSATHPPAGFHGAAGVFPRCRTSPSMRFRGWRAIWPSCCRASCFGAAAPQPTAPRSRPSRARGSAASLSKKDNAPLFILLKPNKLLSDEPAHPTPASTSWRWVQDHWKKVFEEWSVAEKIEFRSSGTNDADYNTLHSKYQLIRDDKASGVGKAPHARNAFRVAQERVNRVCQQNGLGGAAARAAATVAEQTEAADAAGEVGADGMVTPTRAPPAEPPAERVVRGPSKRARQASMEKGIERIAEMQERRLAQEEVNRRQEKREDYQRQEQQRADDRERQEQQRADDREGKEWKTSRGNRLLAVTGRFCVVETRLATILAEQ